MKNVYLIGEIGQNHNGSVEIAKLLIDLIARPVKEELFDLTLPGMDAVKLTRRDLKQELSGSQMNRPYDSPHSFGRTYGEHRAALELSDEQHFEIYKHAKANGLELVETLCAPGCLSLLELFTPDRLKVASRDLTNLPLLTVMAETKIPIILSTGMADVRELDEALEAICKYHSDISILHCVSQYPTHPTNANLNSIIYLQEHYSDFTIGYSDHTIGISTPVAAVAMGSEIIEKHITIDRLMKGTDQLGSLGPEGVHRMARDIRLLSLSMGQKDIFVAPGIEATRAKLERSIATKRAFSAGELVTEKDLHLLSPGDGVKWTDRSQLVGKRLLQDLPADEIIYPQLVE